MWCRGCGGERWPDGVIRRTLNLGELGEPLPTMPPAFCGIARPELFDNAEGFAMSPWNEDISDHHPYDEARYSNCWSGRGTWGKRICDDRRTR